MAHEIYASIVLRVEDNEPKEWASALSVVAAEWSKFLAAVEPLHGTATFDLNEVSGRGGNGVRRRGRPRKGVVADDEAALMLHQPS